jgi:hypothetical protein
MTAKGEKAKSPPSRRHQPREANHATQRHDHGEAVDDRDQEQLEVEGADWSDNPRHWREDDRQTDAVGVCEEIHPVGWKRLGEKNGEWKLERAWAAQPLVQMKDPESYSM